MSRQLIIAGAHRSGTSVTASLLQRAGLFLGYEFDPPPPSNPHGLFEDREIRIFHHRVLRDNGATWQVTSPLVPEISAGRWQELREIVERRQAEHQLWGFKEPRACLFIEPWRRLLPDAKVLIVYRHFSDAAYSLERRAARELAAGVNIPELNRRISEDPELSLRIWLTYNEALLEFARGHPSEVLAVSFESLQQGAPVLRRLEERWRLGLEEASFDDVFDAGVTSARPGSPPTLDPSLVERLDATLAELTELERETMSAKPPAPRGPRASARFEHLIITRFSLRFLADGEVLPVDWLNDRLRLLEAYCLPGIAAQTCGDFRWLLLCDESTDRECLAELGELTSQVQGSSVITTRFGGSALPAIQRALDPATRTLITTRVDSDDGLALDFVERVQSYVGAFSASGGDPFLVNFSRGHTLETSGPTLYDSFQPQGPFMSLFETTGAGGDVRTIYSGNHGQLYLRHPLHVDGSDPAWLQVIHGTNVSNHVRRIDLPSGARELGSRFAIRPELAHGLSGVAAPDASRIRMIGERGTEGFGAAYPASEAGSTR